MNRKNKSLLCNFGLNIITLTIGTLLFGILLEASKSDKQLRTDIVKEYYRPLKSKEEKCSSLHMSLITTYQSMGDDYTFLRDRYLSYKNGTGPELNSEYQQFLTGLISDVHNKNSASSKINNEYSACRVELSQLQVEAALVTGTYDKISILMKDKNHKEAAVRARFRDETLDSMIKKLPPNIANKLVDGFFDAGNLSKPIDPSQDQFLTDMINDTMPEIIKIFPAIADFNVKLSLLDQNYYNRIDLVLENEISSRFNRGILSKLGL
ncbi:hypothetical protein [Yersinia wautersii]|uniref:Uncharacterized protein n=1 Tax=Yersinia wautersii TaxID=1341643 RepID=A0ABP1ZH92_9GAMM|nr:hypothetical protein [Yersinia wautersii]CRG52277.1 Uncharacterised protein [Yersinia wautersii]